MVKKLEIMLTDLALKFDHFPVTLELETSLSGANGNIIEITGQFPYTQKSLFQSAENTEIYTSIPSENGMTVWKTYIEGTMFN